MNSPDDYANARTEQAPTRRVVPPANDGFGDLAAALAASYGLTPDPWQAIVIDDWLSVADGRWAALTCALSVPRQNGKNAIIEIRELFGLVGRGERILHTAHEVKTARKAFKRLQHFFGSSVGDPAAKYPELNDLVAEVRNANGQEGIYLHNGGSIEVAARSKSSGRGFTVDVLVLDEAQEMDDDDLEALMPTTSASPNPQWIITGTPPGPRVSGEVFTRTRADALSGSSARLCWHEWSAAPDDDPDDPHVWAAANPALPAGRLSADVVAGERARFSDDGFRRERLGLWASASTAGVIPGDAWAAQADTESVATVGLAVAVDVTPERDSASVGVAGRRADGSFHVELVEQKGGTAWVVPFLERLAGKNDIRAVVVDQAGAAASLVDELRERKLRVVTTTARDMASACGQFHDGIVSGWLYHPDQTQLNYALSVARKRTLGDAWAWNRKNSGADITPVVACTLALWGAQNTKAKPRTNRAVFF